LASSQGSRFLSGGSKRLRHAFCLDIPSLPYPLPPKCPRRRWQRPTCAKTETPEPSRRTAESWTTTTFTGKRLTLQHHRAIIARRTADRLGTKHDCHPRTKVPRERPGLFVLYSHQTPDSESQRNRSGECGSDQPGYVVDFAILNSSSTVKNLSSTQ